MSRISGVLGATFLCAFIIISSSGLTTKTLELVHVLFRHGDRTPDQKYIYPKDPYINNTYYPIGYGELTNEGKLKEYTLGKLLRKRYKTFLGPYTPYTIDARSTYYNRIKMSLQLVLAGLFPPEKDQLWKKKLKWQPIPFSYNTQFDDRVLGFRITTCPEFMKTLDTYLHSQEGIDRVKKYERTFKYLSEHTGWHVNTTYLMSELYLTLSIEKELNFSLPSWTNQVFPEILSNATIDEYHTRTATNKLKRLSVGFLLKKIIEDSQAKEKGLLHKDMKMYLYSAHEHNIGSMLSLLDVDIKKVPPYGSYMLFELYKIKNIYAIQIYYQDYTTKRPTIIKIPKCGYVCPLDFFLTAYKNVMPGKYDRC